MMLVEGLLSLLLILVLSFGFLRFEVFMYSYPSVPLNLFRFIWTEYHIISYHIAHAGRKE
jgi:hypothetical protein